MSARAKPDGTRAFTDLSVEEICVIYGVDPVTARQMPAFERGEDAGCIQGDSGARGA